VQLLRFHRVISIVNLLEAVLPVVVDIPIAQVGQSWIFFEGFFKGLVLQLVLSFDTYHFSVAEVLAKSSAIDLLALGIYLKFELEPFLVFDPDGQALISCVKFYHAVDLAELYEVSPFECTRAISSFSRFFLKLHCDFSFFAHKNIFDDKRVKRLGAVVRDHVFTIVHEAIGGCSEALGKDKSYVLIRLACVFVVNDKLV